MIPDEIAAYQANPTENPPKSIFDSKDLLKVLVEQTHQQLLDFGKQHGEAGVVLEQSWRVSFTNNLRQAMNLIAPPAYWAVRANHTGQSSGVSAVDVSGPSSGQPHACRAETPGSRISSRFTTSSYLLESLLQRSHRGEIHDRLARAGIGGDH